MAVAAVAGAALVSTATPAAAAPILNVTGGKTTTVSDPALGPALLGAGILPLPVAPGTLDKIDLQHAPAHDHAAGRQRHARPGRVLRR